METSLLERTYTIEEYLEKETASVEKHEFHNGKITPVSGASFIHNAIAVNVLTALKIATRLSNRVYYVSNSNTKVWIPAITRFVYPDALVVSGKPAYYEGRRDTITNPRLVVEILSPGTQKKDRTSKFDLYRTLPSLEEYVLIDQNQPIISTFSAPRAWQETLVQGMDQQVDLISIDVVLSLADVYEGVDELRG